MGLVAIILVLCVCVYVCVFNIEFQLAFSLSFYTLIKMVSRAIGSLHCSDTQLIVVPAVYLSTDLCTAPGFGEPDSLYHVVVSPY